MTKQHKLMYRPTPFTRVAIDDAFWQPRQMLNRTTTLPVEHENLQQTGHLDALKLDWEPGDRKMPHPFWESDLAKWLEAACYVLAQTEDEALTAQVDEMIELLAGAQQPDGYLNAHFTVVEPQQRWANLRDLHELYCAGHLIEAAVAHYEASGRRDLLAVMTRYADYIDSVFGPGAEQRQGYPGHEEIELALVKLYRATGEERYLKLAQYFVDERGRQPHYFDKEAHARGDDPQDYRYQTHEYSQSHRPLREQDEAVGHAVRAFYLYSAVADLALETGDASLRETGARLFESVMRRMYITGGVGSSRHNEGFTHDFDLPNETAYAETCAAIALIFWMQRLLRLDLDGRYGDALERALYNGFLSGLSLDGTQFFYVNPLAVQRGRHAIHNERHTAQRRGWFGCACCPPNVARLLASLGDYVYGESEGEIAVHLYVQGSARCRVAGQTVRVEQTTNYPWDGDVRLRIEPEKPLSFTLKLRVPGWCDGATLHLNGEPVGLDVERGYARLERTWQPGDEVHLRLPMPVQRVYADPRVTASVGRVALMRGPLVFCLEEVDNGPNLDALCLPRAAELHAEWEAETLGGVMVVQGEAVRERVDEGSPSPYRSDPPATEPVTLRAVPYYAWANRAIGDMLVWMREG